MTAAERIEQVVKTPMPHGPLVTADWLCAHLGDPRVRVLDVRGRIMPPNAPGAPYVALHREYAEGHVPGAHFFDWTQHLLARAPSPGSREGALTALRAALARAGVTRDRTVVLYDDMFNLFASRGAWLLRALGYETVRVLDGGWNEWGAEGFPVTRELPPASGAAVTLRGDPVIGVGTDDLVDALARGALLIDARLPAAYEGRVADGARRGHIPGAINVPYNRLTSGRSGRFASPHEVRRTLAHAGVEVARLPDDVIVYCSTGVMAAGVWMAFELVGVRHARIYEPSFAAWSADPARPVALGPTP